MMIPTQKIALCILLFSIIGTSALAETDSSAYFVQPSQGCKHGIFSQPDGGPFSVYFFCDDAGGVNIGIILTEPGAGPGSIKLPGIKNWSGWDLNDRFWQDKDWATDVSAFTWSPSLKYAYVATSGIYGNGGLFKLDLVTRTFELILPIKSAGYYPRLKSGYSTNIKTIDPENNKATAEIHFFENGHKQSVSEDIILE